MTRAPLATRDEVAAVAAGGVIGALLRAAFSAVVPHEPTSWPWATFAVNLLGCVALGLVLAWVDGRHAGWAVERPRRARLARPFLASGVLGGFTTFSTFSVEAVQLIDTGHGAVAAAYAVSSAVLGVLLVLAGRSLGAALVGPAPVSLREDEEL